MSFLQTHGYGILFLIMIVEGPIITAAAAYAASLGWLNIWLVFGLSLLGDTISDILHYIIGRYLKQSTVQKWSSFFGIEKIPSHLDTQFKKYPARSLFLLKLTPPLAQPGMVLAGTFRVPFRTFWLYTFLGSVIRTTILTCIGFFFGFVAGKIFDYFHLANYWLIVFILSIVAIYVLLQWVVKHAMNLWKNGKNGKK
jgi:membrane protein DedA with SNARE-associated domain